MERGTLPCSALTFVRNGGESFRTCLECCLFCSEHVILDGGSIDGTVEMAKEYGCLVIAQDPALLNADRYIIDYAGITNQGIRAATQQWILINSADESLSGDLVAACMGVVRKNIPGAWLFRRMYVLDGKVVEHASSYPNEQIRLFHKDAVSSFAKIIHERPILRAGITPSVLGGMQYVPLGANMQSIKCKYCRYIDLEVSRFGSLTFIVWLQIVMNRCKSIAYRIFKIMILRFRHRWNSCLPLRYEWLNIWYALKLIGHSRPHPRKK